MESCGDFPVGNPSIYDKATACCLSTVIPPLRPPSLEERRPRRNKGEGQKKSGNWIAFFSLFQPQPGVKFLRQKKAVGSQSQRWEWVGSLRVLRDLVSALLHVRPYSVGSSPNSPISTQIFPIPDAPFRTFISVFCVVARSSRKLSSAWVRRLLVMDGGMLD